MLSIRHILYNPFKHHLSFIRKRIGDSGDVTSLMPEINTFGQSKMDVYTGNLSADTVCREIIALIPADDADAFERWIAAHDGYRVLRLSDRSEWTIRLSDKNAFIHIHPARYSVDTIRVSANVMKTTTLYAAALHHGLVNLPDTASINQLRTKFLDLSPISARSERGQIDKLIELLTKPRD